MKIYFSGAEVPTHRTLMAANGVTDASLSYMGLRRRTKMIQPWNIREKVKEPISLLLEPGASTVNARPDAYHAHDLMGAYEEFAARNADAVEHVLDFDILHLGLEHRRAHLRRMFEAIGEKLVPVWHAQDGVAELTALAVSFPTIALADVESPETNLGMLLQSLARHDTAFIGLAMLKPELMKKHPLAAVTGTSWLSPQRYGETVLYTGRELHRFHAQYKQDVRRRYRTQIAALGLDPAKIEDGDTKELLGLSLRSWHAFARELVTHRPAGASGRNGDPAVEEVDRGATEKRHEPKAGRVRKPMPGTAFTVKHAGGEDDEGPAVRTIQYSGTGMLACESCFLKDSCPDYAEGEDCAYDFPLELGAPGQKQELLNAVISLQAERVFFATMAEKREGGMPTPAASTEIDRLVRLIGADHKFNEASLTLNMRASTGDPTLTGGIISQLFGRDPADMRAIEPVHRDPVVSQVLDAEVVEES